jgi:hypothetical protein
MTYSDTFTLSLDIDGNILLEEVVTGPLFSADFQRAKARVTLLTRINGVTSSRVQLSGKISGETSPRSSPVSAYVSDVSLMRRKRNIQVRESAYSTRFFLHLILYQSGRSMGEPAKLLANQASRSSAASSRRFCNAVLSCHA